MVCSNGLRKCAVVKKMWSFSSKQMVWQKPASHVSARVLFLCSEKARHIQGTAIAVDGGSTMGYY